MKRSEQVLLAGLIVPLLFARPGIADPKDKDWQVEKGSNGDVWVSATDPSFRMACTTDSDCTNLADGLHLEKADKFGCVKVLPGHEDIKDKGPWCFRAAKPAPPPPPRACRPIYEADPKDPASKPDHKLCDFGGPKGSETIVILPMTPTTKVVELPEDVHLPCAANWECGRMAERFNRSDPAHFACRKPVATDGKELEPYGEGPYCFARKDSECKAGEEIDRHMWNSCSKKDVCRPMEEYEYAECTGKGNWPDCIKKLKRPASVPAGDWTKCRKDRKDNKERRSRVENSPWGKCTADCWSRFAGKPAYSKCNSKCYGLATD